MDTLLRERAIHMLRSGHSTRDVAQALERSERWVRKWNARYEEEGWDGLQSRSRRPHRLARQTPESVRRAVLETRSELEAAAARGEGLKYIGSAAIQQRLQEKGVQPLPSRRTIERVLQQAGMTRPRHPAPREQPLPHLHSVAPHTLVQVDIVPHFLTGGEAVACFNAIDVGSRYPTGQPFSHRRAKDALAFLVHTWQTLGIPTYTQMDNEGCFSGGHTHPYVLGQVVRLCLMVGTEPVFSAIGEPKSQGHIERFHQDYHRHVWEGTHLANIEAVREQGERFFHLYRQRPHPQMGGETPEQKHRSVPVRRLAADFRIPQGRLPLYAGRVHFIRRVERDHTVRVLNVSWAVPPAAVGQGVWVTLELQPEGARLSVYDGAPDAVSRRLLVQHPFPLREPVLPRPEPKEPPPRLPVAAILENIGALGKSLALALNGISGTKSWRSPLC